MQEFRATVRFGGSPKQYHMVDLKGSGLGEVLRAVAEALPPEVAATADLIEIRRVTLPEEREYGPE